MGDAFCISQGMLGLAAVTHSPELENSQFIGKDSAARRTRQLGRGWVLAESSM